MGPTAKPRGRRPDWLVVVWTSYGSSGGDASDRSIQGQRYDSAGSAEGEGPSSLVAPAPGPGQEGTRYAPTSEARIPSPG